MTLLTQHSAPFQNYSPFPKWTWYIDSLGQRSLHSHVRHPYQLLAMFLNHSTPYFSMLTPAAIVLLMLYEILPPGTGYFCNSLLFQYQYFSGQFTFMQIMRSCCGMLWCYRFIALFLRQGCSETWLFRFLNILHWVLLLLSALPYTVFQYFTQELSKKANSVAAFWRADRYHVNSSSHIPSLSLFSTVLMLCN